MHLIVPKSQHQISHRLQNLRPIRFVNARMLPAVHLNDETSVGAEEIHDMYLFEVKKPEESKYPWDYYKLRATIPAAEAFRPLKDGGCPLVSG